MRAIVSCAIGPDYAHHGVKQSGFVSKFGGSVPYKSFGQLPSGCPKHLDQPYAFKIFAIREMRSQGFEQILWLDSTLAPCASLDGLWSLIEESGWYAPAQGDARLGFWCSDTALAHYGFNREIAKGVPLVLASVLGFDFRVPIANQIWDGWIKFFGMGTFAGAWRSVPNEPVKPWGNKLAGHVSSDPTVEGHRHDEAAFSAVLYNLGLRPYPDYFIGNPNQAGVCLTRI